MKPSEMIEKVVEGGDPKKLIELFKYTWIEISKLSDVDFALDYLKGSPAGRRIRGHYQIDPGSTNTIRFDSEDDALMALSILQKKRIVSKLVGP